MVDKLPEPSDGFESWNQSLSPSVHTMFILILLLGAVKEIFLPKICLYSINLSTEVYESSF